MEKSHLYKNCVVVRCPLTEGTMMTGSVKKVAKWARQNSYNLMDFRKPVETL